MGKTPKKAAPGGDERNLYVRRLKATTASSKASETSLPERQRESDYTKRAKPTGIQRKVPPGTVKTFKSKLHTPTKLGLNHPPKRLGRPPGSTNKKKHLVPVKPLESKSHSMQPESEETEVKPEATNKTEENKEEIITKATTETVDGPAEKEEAKNNVEENPAEEQNISSENHTEQTSEEVQHTGSTESIESSSQENLSKQTSEIEDPEGNSMKLSLEAEESQECTTEKESKDETTTEELLKDLTNGTTEKEGQKEERKEEQNDSQTDTENYSVDIVESTTSEVSETSESTSQQEQKEIPEQKPASEESFVTYDSKILLKDVQIKLNDCLKENSKLYDVSNTTETSSPLKDLSFGRTLRNISGRHSLSRMRHVTVREHRFSPNSSMYVNISNASINPEEAFDTKILRYRSGVDDSFSTNGSPAPERKRKLDAEGGWYSAKKPKTESENNSFLNTSIGLLRGLRRPVQVSTPNVGPQKFSTSNLDVSGLADDGQDTDGSRKWCVVM